MTAQKISILEWALPWIHVSRCLIFISAVPRLCSYLTLPRRGDCLVLWLSQLAYLRWLQLLALPNRLGFLHCACASVVYHLR